MSTPATVVPPSASAPQKAVAALTPKSKGKSTSSKKSSRPAKAVITEERLQEAAKQVSQEGAQASERLTDQYGRAAVAALAVVAAWIFGLVGLRFYMVPIILAAALFANQRLEERLKVRRVPLLEAEMAKTDLTMLREGRESTQWLNDLVLKAWPHSRGFVETTIRAQVRNQIDLMLGKRPEGASEDSALPPRVFPTWIEDVILPELFLGNMPPTINWVKCTRATQDDTEEGIADIPAELRGLLSGRKPETSDQTSHGPLPIYILNLDFSFPSNLRVVAQVNIGTKFIFVPLPLSVRDVSAAGTIKLKLSLTDQMPFVKEIAVSLANVNLDVSIRPLLLFDLLRIIPGVHGFVKGMIEGIVENLDLTIPLLDVSNRDEAFAAMKVAGKPALKKRLLNLPGSALKKVVGGGGEKEELVVTVFGHVVVRIIEGKDLPAMDSSIRGKSSDPFVIVKLDDAKKTTEIKWKTLNPVWNQTFEFTIHENSTKKIEFEMFDKDRVGGDDFMGEAFLDFNSFKDDDPQELWLPLLNKNGEPVPKAPKAQLKVKVTYFAE